MALKPIKYIEIDDIKGILYSAGKQSLLIPVTFIKAIDSIFVQLVGKKGADILIYKIGEGLGKEYVQNLEAILKKEKTELRPEMKVRINCSAIFMEAGWGRVEIQKIDLTKTVLEVKMTYSPSGEFLEESEYNLERGVIAGIYKEITKEEVYCQLLKRDEKRRVAILGTIKEIPEKIRERKKLVLLTRKELDQKIKETSAVLQERINELEKLHKLTVGRELKMVELKKEIKKLEEELEKYKPA